MSNFILQSTEKIFQKFLKICYSLDCFFGRDSEGIRNTPHWTLKSEYQQRGSHRRLGNAHGAREDPEEASFRRARNAPWAALAGLHHAAQSVWTHNVWPARKTGCHALGLKAVKTPVTGCESCQALSALFPIAGARAANTAEQTFQDRMKNHDQRTYQKKRTYRT